MDSDDPKAVKKSCLSLFVGLLITVLVVGGLYYGHYSNTHFSQSLLAGYEKTLFASHVKTSGRPRDKGGDGLSQNVDLTFEKKPRRRGRILPIIPSLFNLDGASARVHEVWPKLRDDVRAIPGQEVGTVVFCKPGKAMVGRYTNGAPAFAETFTVYSFDAKTGEYLGADIFAGQPPDKIFVANTAGEGHADLVGGLNSLPEAK